MPRLTENAIEELAIELLEALGYGYCYGPVLAPDGATPERASFADVLLVERLRTAISKHNPTVPAEAREDALRQVQRIADQTRIGNVFGPRVDAGDASEARRRKMGREPTLMAGQIHRRQFRSIRAEFGRQDGVQHLGARVMDGIEFSRAIGRRDPPRGQPERIEPGLGEGVAFEIGHEDGPAVRRPV